ncbi:MAG TPA: MAPEG family protein [Pseudoxanthomonas sp.]|nr:MAPEG family protein [Pseudoxanthomonas sp.]
MPLELKMLAWAVVLGLLQLILAATFSTAQRGARWNASARDGEVRPLQGVAARLDRAWRNFMETFPFFAALALAVVVSERANADTALGAQLYLWSRVVYVPIYAAGIPYLRTLVWVVSMVGLLQMLWGLLG